MKTDRRDVTDKTLNVNVDMKRKTYDVPSSTANRYAVVAEEIDVVGIIFFWCAFVPAAAWLVARFNNSHKRTSTYKMTKAAKNVRKD